MRVLDFGYKDGARQAYQGLPVIINGTAKLAQSRPPFAVAFGHL